MAEQFFFSRDHWDRYDRRRKVLRHRTENEKWHSLKMQGIQASSGFQVRVWLNQFRYHPLEMNRQQKGRVKLSEQVV